jgi:hypothetical protein
MCVSSFSLSFINFISLHLYFLHSFHDASILDAAVISSRGYQSCSFLD